MRVVFLSEPDRPFIFLDEVDDSVIRAYLTTTLVPLKKTFMQKRCTKFKGCGIFEAAFLEDVAPLLTAIRSKKLDHDNIVIKQITSKP